MDPWTTAHSAVTVMQKYSRLLNAKTTLRLTNLVLLHFTTPHAFEAVLNEVLGQQDETDQDDDDDPVVLRAKTGQGAVAQWKDFCLVTRRLWVQLPPMPPRSDPGQVACLLLFHASDSFTTE